MLNQNELEILDQFLDELSDRFRNDGCNDWDFPKNWTEEEKRKFVKEFHAWNGDPEEYNPNFLVLMNFSALSMIRRRLKQKSHDYSIKVKNATDSWVKNYLDNPEEYQNFVQTCKERSGPFIIKFAHTGIGVAKKVFDEQGNSLADITDYEAW